MSGSTYILEGHETELAQHSGHEVEVTGTIAGSSGASGTTGSTSGAGSAGTTSSGITAASGGSSSGSMGASGNQRIQVSSVRMVSTSCTNR
ncbi:MAG: hypothetical protein JSU08_09885 [Acidobacteria bacterium]|nr:hypothetical protein [Acidobacteriota bacterium]